MKFIDRVGEENYNTYGTLMKIIEYKNSHNIIVEFQDKYKHKKKAMYRDFKNGNIKNPYDKEYYNIGFLGYGEYTRTIHFLAWKHWEKMLKRCYDPYHLNKYPSYIDCIVCKEWHNFQNFAKWFYQNYYEIPNEQMQIDKDILVKGNKIYSPETCLIVSHRINYLFCKCDRVRGKYPIGVSYDKERNKLSSQCSIFDNNKKHKNMHLGRYDTVEEAFYAYKQFKENYIKQVADEYKDLIPKELYEAMYKYEIDIND